MKPRTRKFYGHFNCRPFFADELFVESCPCGIEILKRISVPRCFNKNDTVLAAGDLPDCLLIHSAGQARVTVSNGINSITDLRLVKRNEILGLNEMIANSFCQMNVETITACVFDCVPRKQFFSFLKDHPEACFRLLTLFGSEINSSYRRFAGSRF